VSNAEGFFGLLAFRE